MLRFVPQAVQVHWKMGRNGRHNMPDAYGQSQNLKLKFQDKMPENCGLCLFGEMCCHMLYFFGFEPMESLPYFTVQKL